MLAQEELQATNEEFEATNEELQATNEELETNNEELQATNEELETTNEELQARTAELQELNTGLRLQRERLAEIVERAPLPVVVLRGRPPIVESFNLLFAAMVGGAAALGTRRRRDLRRAARSRRAGLRERHRERRGVGQRAADGRRQRRLAEVPARTYVFTALPLYDGGDAVGRRRVRPGRDRPPRLTATSSPAPSRPTTRTPRCRSAWGKTSRTMSSASGRARRGIAGDRRLADRLVAAAHETTEAPRSSVRISTRRRPAKCARIQRTVPRARFNRTRSALRLTARGACYNSAFGACSSVG